MTNQKCPRNVKRTIQTSDMALLLIEFIRHPRRAHRLRVSVDSHTTLSLMAYSSILNPLGAMCIYIYARARLPLTAMSIYIYMHTIQTSAYRAQLQSQTRLRGKSLPIE